MGTNVARAFAPSFKPSSAVLARTQSCIAALSPSSRSQPFHAPRQPALFHRVAHKSSGALEFDAFGQVHQSRFHRPRLDDGLTLARAAGHDAGKLGHCRDPAPVSFTFGLKCCVVPSLPQNAPLMRRCQLNAKAGILQSQRQLGQPASSLRAQRFRAKNSDQEYRLASGTSH